MKRSFFLLLLGIAVFSSGCGGASSEIEINTDSTAPLTTQPNWNRFSASKIHPKVHVSYPPGYRVEDGTNNLITVKKNETARIEIFQMKDFGGNRSLDVDNTTRLQSETDAAVPKLMVNRHGYDVWVYYAVDDVGSRDELLSILDTLGVKE